MKNKYKSLLAFSLLMFSCNGGTSSITTSSEGLYSRLTNAIKGLSNSFTATGTLSYANSTDKKEVSYSSLIQYSLDGYYCEEVDITTNEATIQESIIKGEDGNAYGEYLDYNTNKIMKNELNIPYDEYIDNNFAELTVKDLEGIKGQKNWYSIKNTNVSYGLAKFITGYNVSTDGLTVNQFALHFDGDKFDSFYILLDYTEDSDDESTDVYYEQYLFQLNISNVGSTVANKIVPYNHVDDHDILQDALNDLADKNNFTIHFDIKNTNKNAENESFDYYVDFDNKMLYSTQKLNMTTTDPVSNNFVTVPYVVGYKEINNRPIMYFFDPTTGDIIRNINNSEARYDYNDYQGTHDKFRDIDFLLPRVKSTTRGVAAECFKSLGNLKFSTYYNTYERCLLSLIPYDMYEYNEYNFNLDINEEGFINKLILKDSYKFLPVCASQYETSNRTITITYEKYDETTIPSCLMLAK